MGECFIFNYGELPSYCFRKFHDMKNKSEFCDITIIYGSQCITAHRLVLAAAIPYFRDFLGNKENGSEICVEDIDPEALESLIEFAYTCQVKITSDNAKDLFSAACILQIEEVRDACSVFLAERLNPNNVLSTRQLAESFSCAVLLESVDSYICRNFDRVAETQDFLTSSFACVKQLIGRNDLQCSKEGNVFEFVIKWIKASPEARKSCLPQLLREIRMSLLTPEYLTSHVYREEFVRSSIECRDIVEDARTYHFLPNLRSEISSFVTVPRDAPRINAQANDPLTPGIYAVSRTTVLRMQHFDVKIGEWNEQETNSFQSDFHNGALLAGNGVLYYCDRRELRSRTSGSGTWIRSGDIKSSKHNFGAAVLNKKLYLCGGQGDGLISSTVECYDLETNDSMPVKSMLFARCYPGAGALGEYLYVLGGSCSGLIYNSVEKYDPETDLWVAVTPMLVKRCGMGCTTLGDKIYVCGGVRSFSFGNDDDDGKDELLASVEVYDMISSTWSWVSAMRIPRFSCSLVTYYGKLYVIGGYDENDAPMNITDIYDPVMDEWKPGPSLTNCTEFVQAVAVPSSDSFK